MAPKVRTQYMIANASDRIRFNIGKPPLRRELEFTMSVTPRL